MPAAAQVLVLVAEPAGQSGALTHLEARPVTLRIDHDRGAVPLRVGAVRPDGGQDRRDRVGLQPEAAVGVDDQRPSTDSSRTVSPAGPSQVGRGTSGSAELQALVAASMTSAETQDGVGTSQGSQERSGGS